MAKDDYFVIVYQVLKYLYECLKDGKTPDKDKLSYNRLGINKNYWDYIIANMVLDDLIVGLWEISPKGIGYIFDFEDRINKDMLIIDKKEFE